MTEKVRIEKIMQHEHMSSGQFAIEIGVQNSTLSHILNNRNNPSLDVLKKILNRFPEISSDWLILGQGSMFRQEFNSQELTLFDQEPLTDSKSAHHISKTEPADARDTISSSFSTLHSTDPEPYERTRAPESLNTNIDSRSNRDEITAKPASPPSVSLGTLPIPDIKIEKRIEKKIEKIIIYFSDRTFQEFESK